MTRFEKLPDDFSDEWNLAGPLATTLCSWWPLQFHFTTLPCLTVTVGTPLERTK